MSLVHIRFPVFIQAANYKSWCVSQFVEKRKEMKSDGRTEKELEENYCFLLTTSPKVTPPVYCANG